MKAPVAILAAGLLLAACGTRTEDRALSGGGIGAVAGTAVGAVTGLSLLEGALIGAGIGAAAGALTDSNQVDLGEPIWRGQSASASSAPAAAADPLVRDIQTALNARGYAAGPADGVAGPQTRAAIRAYQQANGLLVDGQASPQLLGHLRRRASNG